MNREKEITLPRSQTIFKENKPLFIMYVKWFVYSVLRVLVLKKTCTHKLQKTLFVSQKTSHIL